MLKNLSTAALGISGRQSELIELALTYRFRSVDLTIDDFVKKSQSKGLEHTGRFLDSANLKIGTIDLPVQWEGDETIFKADLAALAEVADVAAAVGATRCITDVQPASDRLPYHENFEQHRKRLHDIAGVLAERNISLGIGVKAAAQHRDGFQYQFIHQVEDLLTLIKTISADNIGLALDSWNWRIGGGANDQLSELQGDKVISVRLADAPADVDPASMEDNQRLIPGSTGYVDCVGILRALRGIDYKGPVTIYPHPDQLTGMTRDAIVQLASQTLDAHIKQSAEEPAAEDTLTEAASEA